MKKLFIILAFIPLFGFGQKSLLGFNGGILSFDNALLSVCEDPWLINSGTFGFTQVSDTFYVDCITDGSIYQKTVKAYGIWEFKIKKVDDNTDLLVDFIAHTKEGADGFQFLFTSGESMRIIKPGISIKFRTASAYASLGVIYTIKIERSEANLFTTQIKGGEFGDTYINIDITGGSGANPFTDATNTTSYYQVVTLKADDFYSDSTIYEGYDGCYISETNTNPMFLNGLLNENGYLNERGYIQ
jgi:hypothetical protein